MSVWGLLMASHKHHSVLLDALNGKEVSIKTTPQEVQSIMGVEAPSHPSFTFSNEELLADGEILWKGGIVVVLADGEILAPICRLEEGGNKLQMSGFKFVNMADYGLKDERYTTNLLPHCSHEVIAMMKNVGYKPGMGLKKEGKGVAEFPKFKT